MIETIILTIIFLAIIISLALPGYQNPNDEEHYLARMQWVDDLREKRQKRRHTKARRIRNSRKKAIDISN